MPIENISFIGNLTTSTPCLFPYPIANYHPSIQICFALEHCKESVNNKLADDITAKLYDLYGMMQFIFRPKNTSYVYICESFCKLSHPADKFLSVKDGCHIDKNNLANFATDGGTVSKLETLNQLLKTTCPSQAVQDTCTISVNPHWSSLIIMLGTFAFATTCLCCVLYLRANARKPTEATNHTGSENEPLQPQGRDSDSGSDSESNNNYGSTGGPSIPAAAAHR